MRSDPDAKTLTIRRATAEDSVLLAELGARTFAESFGVFNTPENMRAYLAASFSPEIQARELADPLTRFLILEQGGAPAGYARLKWGPAPAAVQGRAPVEIVRFYICQAWIGLGAAARLMQACLEEAASSGSDAIWLDVWEHNPRAIAFYVKWGLEQVGTQAFQLGDEAQTDWVMARPVDLAAPA